jgi:imidazolonepropionase-like amidohydrolase
MDLATGDSNWIAYPVDRDDMESRATRDLMPGYAYLPGGKEIVLGLRGKIQRMSLANGKATVIPFKAKVSQMIGEEVYFRHRIEDSATVKAKIARTPVLSPDRSTIAFCAFGRLYTMDLRDKTPRRVTTLDQNEFHPAWSPDGQQITFASWDPKRGGSIHVVRPNGGGLRTLTSRKAYYRSPIFTPDGKTIVFTSGTTEEGFDTAIRMAEPQADELDPSEIGRGSRYRPSYLQSIPANGGEVKQLMPVPGSYFFLKDPNRIYVNSGGGVRSMNLDGTDARDIARFTGVATGGFSSANIVISPDGSQIVVDTDFKFYTANLPMVGQVVTLGAAGGPTPVKKLSQSGGDNVAWTADGKGIFWSLGNKVYIQDLDQEKPTEIEVNVQVPRYTPRGKVLLRGARLITMKGDQVIPNGDILVVDNKIAQIGPKGSFKVPADAKVIPMEGKTISPGYVDTHSHWFGNVDTAYPLSWAYLTNLAYGVTTNRDPQSGSDQIYDFADAIAAGYAPGPRIYTTGPGVFQGAGAEDKDAVFAHLKRYRDAYDTKTIKEYVTGDRMTMEHVAMACKEYGLTPTTEGALEIKRFIAEASSGYSGHEHALPIELYDDMAQFIAKTRTFYTPTLIVAYGGAFGENYWFTNYDIVNEAKVNKFTPQRALDELIRRRNFWALPEEYSYKMISEGCRKVVEAGGKVGVGCHGEFQGLGSHWEMWMLAEGGMKPLDVLRCATLFGAEAIGLDQDLGSLEVGKMADLVIYDKNPLENIRHTNTIRWVMKDGELFDTHTMNSVSPVAKKLPSLYWEALKPPFLGK